MIDHSQMMTVETFTASVRKALNRAFWDSKNKQEEWYEQPSDINMLHEMYYDGELPKQKIEEYRERMTVIANHLLSSQTFMDIFDGKGKRIKLISSERFRLFEMEGVKVWVVLDLVFQDLESGKFVVVDFKTGKPSSSDKVQLLLYALFLKVAFHLPGLDQIELRNEYLATGKHASFTPRQTDLEYVQSLIQTSVKEMKAYLRVPEQNVPLDMERFEQTKNRAICRRCAFQELCDRG
jgi:CRISPR/Cas system-associated exonuclease Cas4 (RecB family)